MTIKSVCAALPRAVCALRGHRGVVAERRYVTLIIPVPKIISAGVYFWHEDGPTVRSVFCARCTPADSQEWALAAWKDLGLDIIIDHRPPPTGAPPGEPMVHVAIALAILGLVFLFVSWLNGPARAWMP